MTSALRCRHDRDELLRIAIAAAVRSVAQGGGPFGAVVARDGELVGQGTNRVVLDADPTAHAEIAAIRDACRRLATHDLSGCTLLSSCEPCPMCLGAIHWARLGGLVYACTRDDAAAAGFDDARLHRELAAPGAHALPQHQALREEGLAAFRAWAAQADRVPY